MPEFRAFLSGDRPKCGHGQVVPDANPDTLTEIELKILRFTGWEFHRGTCKMSGYSDIKLDLARRGYLIAQVLPWEVEVYLTPKGVTAVWDRCVALQHLRPDTPEYLERVAERIDEQLAFWVDRSSFPAVAATVDQTSSAAA